MILKTFGCSHTFGSELTDPSKTSWPILLGKKLNLPVENWGAPGNANEHIIHSAITESPADKQATIVILTSHARRVYWPETELEWLKRSGGNGEKEYKSYLPVEIPKKPDYSETNLIYPLWLKYHYDKSAMKKYHRFLFNSCIELLKARGHIVYIFNWCIHIVENEYNSLLFMDMGRQNNFPTGPGKHYLEEMQEAWSDHVYKIINEK
jgi:hypothetical protein|tara:strand:+ start:776 stop:1399 length:624 start_codon:yes stop_codon:yes gene_type:complete